jgi:Transposase DDE domain
METAIAECSSGVLCGLETSPCPQTVLCKEVAERFRFARKEDLGYRAVKLRAPKSACRPCVLRSRCLKHPRRTEVRQVHFFNGEAANRPETFTSQMKRKIDSAVGHFLYGLRLTTGEPVLATMTSTLGLRRFTLCGQRKVNTQ